MVNYNWKLYFLDQHYGDYHDTWPLLQLRYVLIYLFEYCATLGLIDVAYQNPRGARGLRITENAGERMILNISAIVTGCNIFGSTTSAALPWGSMMNTKHKKAIILGPL